MARKKKMKLFDAQLKIDGVKIADVKLKGFSKASIMRRIKRQGLKARVW